MSASTAIHPFRVDIPQAELHDITLAIRAFAEQSYRIVRWSEFDRGGHFAAMEVPELFVEDVRSFFRDLT